MSHEQARESQSHDNSEDNLVVSKMTTMVECQANAWATERVFLMEQSRLQPIRQLVRRSRLDDQSRKRSIAKDGWQHVTTTSSM
mmetsp:Transcript_19425/g.40699  ORF Transcript_19425/g.40699 Transcript_19425/m.40699 type:complete len:84 (+) Transcript_19425:51-302(+)